MIDIIIPVHGQFDLLQKCLESIPDACKDIPHRIYITDNQSPGDIREIKEFYSKFPVRVSYSKVNLGFPRACNDGARKGKSPLILFLNSDVILDEGSLAQLASNFEDEKVGVAGMKLLFADDRHAQKNGRSVEGKVQHVGLSFNIKAQVYHVFLGWSADNPRVNRVRKVPAVTGAALMTRRSLWNSLKGFDTAYGAGTYEDCDYSLSAREKGFEVIVDTKAVGHHYTNATASAYGIGFNLEGNSQIFYNKWRNKPELDWSDGYIL